MKKVKLNVKKNSVAEFFNKMLPQSEKVVFVNHNDCNTHEGQVSVYNLMQDEIHFKKNCGIEFGETILIELSDTSRISRSELLNKYTYKAEKYDDITIKMVLIDFDVELIKAIKL